MYPYAITNSKVVQKTDCGTKIHTAMLTSLSEMRSRARQSLSGHWGEAVLITLVYAVVNFSISAITSLIALLSVFSLATAIFQASYYVALYRAHRGSDQHDKFLDLLFDLKEGKWWKYLVYQMTWVLPLVIVFCIILVIYCAGLFAADILGDVPVSNPATLGEFQAYFDFMAKLSPVILLCVVGIYYFSLGMALVPFIIYDHPELGCLDTLRRSWFMMKGHKWELFLLMLSFIGWDLLSVFTLCILQLWITPYKQTALAEFYLQVKAEHGELGDKVVYEEDIESVEAEEIK